MSNPVYNPVRLANGRLIGHTAMAPSIVAPVPEDGLWLTEAEVDEYFRIMGNRVLTTLEKEKLTSG